jgi:hypothetical protein
MFHYCVGVGVVAYNASLQEKPPGPDAVSMSRISSLSDFNRLSEPQFPPGSPNFFLQSLVTIR